MTSSSARHGPVRPSVTVSVGLVALLWLAFGLRMIGLGDLSLIGDESYYWLWSRHPDWSYYDHPSGIALLVRASTGLAGRSHFGIRWLNAFVGTAAVALAWQVGRRLVSRRAGFVGAAAIAVGAPYLITSRFVYTNALTLSLMLTSLLAFWRMTRRGAGAVSGLAFGATTALLFNAKYLGYVYACALVVSLLLDHRQLLRTRRFWIGALAAIVGLLPVLIWNAQHGWASFRWQLAHVVEGALPAGGPLGRAYHAWSYLTGPLILIAVLGLGRWRTTGQRLLTLVALCLLAPVVASPLNSPRNLSTGLVPLFLLAGSRIPSRIETRADWAVRAFLAMLLTVTAVFGIGTLAGLHGSSSLPRSSIAPAILQDAAGWPELARELRGGPLPFFALDYSIAGQIAYYTQQPSTTSWGQFELWGVPPLHDLTVVSLDYLDPQAVTAKLGGAFRQVVGPRRLTVAAPGGVKTLHVWYAYGLRWEQSAFLEGFDFLTLLEELG